jgi:hypothetical protein
MKTKFAGVAATLVLVSTAPAVALELDPDVTPEINLGGTLIVTPELTSTDRPTGGSKEEGDLNLEDSSLLLGFSKYLFDDRHYGFARFGLRIPDDDSDFDDRIFVHQLVVGVGSQSAEEVLGRTNLMNTLVSFPTIRDSDLLDFTHVLNAAANAEGEEFQVYGGVVRGTYYLGSGAWSATGQLTARMETNLDDLSSRAVDSTTKFNGVAAGVAYSLPETVKFDPGIRFAGVAVDVQRAENVTTNTGSHTIPAVIAGASVNLGDNPERSWVLDAQGIYNLGETVPGLAQSVYRAQAESWSAVAAIRYLHRPMLQTRWQGALTAAYKDYADFDDAAALVVVPSFAYRLGSGVELVAQYRYRDNERQLAQATGIDERHRVWLGLRFGLSGTFNESVGERGSILDLEHGIANPGPAAGRH